MSDSDEILVDQEGGLGVITLNRPKALNALTLGMYRSSIPSSCAGAATRPSRR